MLIVLSSIEILGQCYDTCFAKVVLNFVALPQMVNVRGSSVSHPCISFTAIRSCSKVIIPSNSYVEASSIQMDSFLVKKRTIVFK